MTSSCGTVARRRLQRALTLTGRLFSNAQFSWSLNGGAAVSVMVGHPIRAHSDIDVSLEAQDSVEVSRHLERQGAGLFVLKPPMGRAPSPPTFERVEVVRSQDELSPWYVRILVLNACHEPSNPRLPLPLHVHFSRQTLDGREPGVLDTVVPREWTHSRVFEYHGVELRVAHPAKVAYDKLHMDRAIDTTDLEALCRAGKLVTADVVALRAVLTAERDRRRSLAESLLRPILRPLTDDMDAATAASAILFDSVVGPRLRPRSRAKVIELAKAYEALRSKDPQLVEEMALRVLGITGPEERRFSRLRMLDLWTEVAQRVDGSLIPSHSDGGGRSAGKSTRRGSRR